VSAQVLKNVAFPTRLRYEIIPDLVDDRVEAALHTLLAADELRQNDLLLHIVDHGILAELEQALAIKSVADPKQDPRLESLSRRVAAYRHRIRERIAVANQDPIMSKRREGEAADVETFGEEDHIEPPSGSELMRRFEAERLWRRSGVFFTVETFANKPGEKKVDTVDKELGKLAEARMKALRIDYTIDIKRLLDFPTDVARAARTVWELMPAYRDPFEQYPVAVSFIRILKFTGHGNAGDTAEKPEASFGFEGQFTPTTMKDLESAAVAAAFKSMPLFMAPGATLHFDGCELGRSEKGKVFMGKVASLVLGRHKRGFVKANTIQVQPGFTTGVNPVHAGKPVTYRWPQEF
jgi:hypothetical protein